jgi:hypothetical protein
VETSSSAWKGACARSVPVSRSSPVFPATYIYLYIYIYMYICM